MKDIVKPLIQGSLLQFTRTLMSAMPKVNKVSNFSRATSILTIPKLKNNRNHNHVCGIKIHQVNF